MNEMENEEVALVGPVADFDVEKAHHISVKGENILLVYREEKWHAFSLRCPHKGAQMRVEDLKGDILACPFHAWYFDLNNNGHELHNYIDLAEYRTIVNGANLYISIV